MLNDAMQCIPSTEHDYKQLHKLLEKEKTQFHAFDLKSEKPLKVVIRGIPTEMPEEEIKHGLEEKKYPATKITRMQGKNGLYSLALVEKKN